MGNFTGCSKRPGVINFINYKRTVVTDFVDDIFIARVIKSYMVGHPAFIRCVNVIYGWKMQIGRVQGH